MGTKNNRINGHPSEREGKSIVLISDDSQLNLRVLSETLGDEYEIILVSSGKAAVERAKSEHPDIILLDIIMPDMDGYEVLRALKSSGETKDIPIIFITSLGNPENETKGLFLGAVDYIAKPFNANVVRARVNTHLKIARQMQIIERLGLIDPLTEIANRRRFDQQIEIEWARALREKKPLSLLLIDIDDFKLHNDNYGHISGDAALQMAARVFSEDIKRPGDILCRIGGDEFAVLLPNTDLPGAVTVSEKLRSSIEQAKIQCGASEDAYMTISLGVETVTPRHTDSIEEFFSRCDKKLYAAKRGGKNKVSYSD